jgi:hypothetical protein
MYDDIKNRCLNHLAIFQYAQRAAQGRPKGLPFGQIKESNAKHTKKKKNEI